jgi:hypothetical protein
VYLVELYFEDDYIDRIEKLQQKECRKKNVSEKPIKHPFWERNTSDAVVIE